MADRHAWLLRLADSLVGDGTVGSRQLRYPTPEVGPCESFVAGGWVGKAGLRGGSFPVSIAGQEILLGGDLIVQFGTQQACHSVCLAQAHQALSGSDRIPVKFRRGGKLRETVIDVSETRRNFLAGD